MIKMVNLTCRHCGMSLDVDAGNLQAYCPNCGNALLITVKQLMDILDEKKEIKQKSIKYVKDVTLVETKRKKNRIDILPVALIFLIVSAIVLFIWKSGL
ncbi:MAG: hypothetical protein J6Y20_05660 [Lachnospiraceae bacterium]|nr:hypothetical protein [Lachnospiraceae bacterium]